MTFLNGGGLTASGFRLDVPGPDVAASDVRALFVQHLGLLMVDGTDITNLEVFEEQHKGSRGVPLATGPKRVVELNHVIRAGMTTYPGLPGPEIRPHLTREASQAQYAPGTEFQIDDISMVGNTGTYLDSPFHRYTSGVDLAGLPLTSLADLPVPGGERPAHSTLLAAGVPVLEHLTGLDQRPATGAHLHAAPPRIEAFSTFPVRAYAVIDG